MADQRDEGEGLMDKVKNALGMGDRDDAAVDDDDREPGWAGVGQMMDDRDDPTRVDGGQPAAYPNEETVLAGDGTPEWTRGEAASGRTPFTDDDEADLGADRGQDAAPR